MKTLEDALKEIELLKEKLESLDNACAKMLKDHEERINKLEVKNELPIL